MHPQKSPPLDPTPASAPLDPAQNRATGYGGEPNARETPAEGEGGPKTLAGAFAAFRQRPKAAPAKPAFAVSATQFHAKTARAVTDRKIAAEKRQSRKCIQPKNAEVLLPHLPTCEEGRLHALIRGDFVFCDLVCAIIERRGPPRRLVLVTLSLSKHNVAALEKLATVHNFPIDFLLSDFFEGTNKAIFAALKSVEARCPLVRVRVARSHCKITLFDYPDAPLVVESSANLRSSRNLEQLSVFCDRELLNFHAAWIEEAAATG